MTVKVLVIALMTTNTFIKLGNLDQTLMFHDIIKQ